MRLGMAYGTCATPMVFCTIREEVRGVVWEDKLKTWKKAGQWHVEVY